MACFHLLEAIQDEETGLVKIGDGIHDRRQGRLLWLPCGKCIGCREVKARSWAIRCMHEAQMHKESAFITLTYREDPGPSLKYKDFQLFMKRIRRRYGPTPFFMSGEYGEKGGRPHWHAILFGREFSRDYPVTTEAWGSHELEKLWPQGFSSHGDCTYESAKYVAGYVHKKISGDMADTHYRRMDFRTGELVTVVPEFGRMSLRPAIGKTWWEKYGRETWGPRDGVIVKGGKKIPTPRSYDKWLKELSEDESERIKSERYWRSYQWTEDTTKARLKVRETCAIAKRKFMKEKAL